MNQMENVALGDRTLSQTIGNLCLISEENALTRSSRIQQLLGSILPQREMPHKRDSALTTALLSGWLWLIMWHSPCLFVCLPKWWNCLGQSLGSDLKGGVFNCSLTNIVWKGDFAYRCSSALLRSCKMGELSETSFWLESSRDNNSCSRQQCWYYWEWVTFLGSSMQGSKLHALDTLRLQ